MSDKIYDFIFRVAEVLELPVVLLTLLALAAALVEVGAFITELIKRRKRTFLTLAKAGSGARKAVDDGRVEEAAALLNQVAWSSPISKSLAVMIPAVGKPGADTRIAKELADFDFGRQARLSRTRLLVRLGPALGLMGTLIPLAPALDGLARGDVDTLTENLRLAFSVTVLGLIIGVIALALSLFRERMYGQDFSDLEYIAALLTDDDAAAAAAAAAQATAVAGKQAKAPKAPKTPQATETPKAAEAPETAQPAAPATSASAEPKDDA